MTALTSFRAEILSSNFKSQASQHSVLKADILRVTNQMSELKAENTKLRADIDELKAKVAHPNSDSSLQPHSIVSQVLLETFERERYQSSLIFYGIAESTSLLVIESPRTNQLLMTY